MQPLEILIGPNPILERICRPDFRISERLISEMFCLMRQHNGLGLAAPQVGINARLFVTHWGEVFINPIITWRHPEKMLIPESCLSFPDVVRIQSRRTSVIINGHWYKKMDAVVIQHELDHLDGITIATGAQP